MPLPLRFMTFAIYLSLTACFEAGDTETSAGETPPLISAAETGDLPGIARLITDDSPVDVRDACLWTPLMKAALNGHAEAARRLIEAGADVNLIDKGGYSALMLAASNNHVAVMDLLIDKGADPNLVEQTGGFTALIWAAQLGREAAVSRLLRTPADASARDFDGRSALDWASLNGHQATVALLRTNGRHGGGMADVEPQVH